MHFMGQCVAGCEVARMRISTNKSNVIVLGQEKIAWSLRVGAELQPNVEEFV